MNQKKRHPLILPVYLPTLILSFCRGMLIPVLPLYARTFDISYGLIGLVLAGEGLGTLIGDVPTSILIRKMGRKWVMILGVSCVASSALALFWAGSILEILLYRLLSGIGAALWNISRHAYIADVTPLYQRGRSIAVFGGINRIGTFAGPAVGGAVGALYSLRAPFLVYAALATVAILTSALFIEKNDGRETRATGPAHRSHLSYLFDVLKHHARPLLTAGSGQLFAQGIRTGRGVIIPLYAADIVGLDVQSVGWILSVSSFIDMSMFYPAGLVMDRFGRKFAIVPCFFLQAVGMALVPFTHSFVGLLLAAALIGLGNGIGSGSMMTLGADLAPRESMGEFLSVWRLVGDGGMVSAPMAVGGIADLLGLSTATFVIAGMGLLASGIFAILVPETLRKEAPSPAG